MKPISQELQELLNTLQEAERTLAAIHQFEAEGGQHRLSISVDHPDWQIRETVERVAKVIVPKSAIIKGLIAAAEKDIQVAKGAILTAAMAHGLADETKPHVGHPMGMQTRAAP